LVKVSDTESYFRNNGKSPLLFQTEDKKCYFSDRLKAAEYFQHSLVLMPLDVGHSLHKLGKLCEPAKGSSFAGSVYGKSFLQTIRRDDRLALK